MSAISSLNPNAEVYRHNVAARMNFNASHTLTDLLKSGLGPAGTLKMIVGGAGDSTLTKDGAVVLKNISIIHPTAMLICRAAISQDDETGDGTTSTIILIDSILENCERRLKEGVHPSSLITGLETAKDEALNFLDTFKKPHNNERELLLNVARSALITKLPEELVPILTEIVTESVLTLKKENERLNLFMVEQLTMKSKLATDTMLVKGLVLDHGFRHPLMKKDLKNVYILTINVSLEFENTEVNTSFATGDPTLREKMINAERAFVDGKVNKIIALKNLVCANGEDFLVVNMKGIDTGSLELLQKAGISAVRRAKLRNMERTTLACGGRQMNSVETLSKDCLGWAGHVYEETIGEDKWVFIEEVKEPKSVTILMKGPNQHTLKRIQDAVKDGLRAVNNAMEAKFVVPGAGAFEVALYNHLMEFRKKVEGKDRLGIEAFAAACLEIPRVIAKNASHDCVDVLVRLEAAADKGQIAGVGIEKGDAIDPIALGIWDNVIVKRHQLQSAPAIASQLLAVDEVIRAGGKVQK